MRNAPAVRILISGLFLAILVVMPAFAQPEQAWRLRDRETRLHLIAAGFLDTEADRSPTTSIAKSLLRLRAVHQYAVTANDGTLTDADLASIAGLAGSKSTPYATYNKPLPMTDVERLKKAKAEFDAKLGLTEVKAGNGVRFMMPSGMQLDTSNKDATWLQYQSIGTTEAEKQVHEARNIVDAISVMAVPANRNTLLELFEEKNEKVRARGPFHESLSLAQDIVIDRTVIHHPKYPQRLYSRMFVGGSRIVGIQLWTNVQPLDAYEPLESHRLHAEHIVSRREHVLIDKDHVGWLTPRQCEEFGLTCSSSAPPQLTPDQEAQQAAQRPKIVNAIAWRLMSAAMSQTIFSDFDDKNGWKRLDAKGCDVGSVPQHKDGNSHSRVRIIAGTDRKFDEQAWRGPSQKKIHEVFDGEHSTGRLGVYCMVVDVPKDAEKRRKTEEAEQDGFRVVRHDRPQIGIAEFRGHDLLRLSDSPSQRPGDRALVYVHGFNNSLADALFHTASIAAAMQGGDRAYWGRFYLFSWPSNEKTLRYSDDLDRSEQAEIHLRAFIRMIARDPNVKRVDFVAHSMGTALLLRALSGLNLGSDRQNEKRLGQIILAAPDINQWVFTSRMSLIAPFASRITVYSTTSDRALRIRELRYGGGPRLGKMDAFDPTEPPRFGNIHMVDVSNLMPSWYSTAVDTWRHTYFSSHPGVLDDLVDVLDAGQDGSLINQEADIIKRRETRKAIGPTEVGEAGYSPKLWKLQPK